MTNHEELRLECLRMAIPQLENSHNVFASEIIEVAEQFFGFIIDDKKARKRESENLEK